MHTVVETPAFISDAEALGMSEGERFEILTFLAMNPDAGDVIGGTGGARKIRFSGRGKGKSGGYRVITFFTGSAFPVFLLNAFAKNEKGDLTRVECATLKKILNEITATFEEHAQNGAARREPKSRVPLAFGGAAGALCAYKKQRESK